MTRARALFDEFGLAGFERAWPHELSGGMRQRLALLRTCLPGRPVLLLDEPFGALDAITRRRMNAWLAGLDLAGHGRAVVLVTHDVDEALLLADRVVVLSDRPGRVVLDLPVPRDGHGRGTPCAARRARPAGAVMTPPTLTVERSVRRAVPTTRPRTATPAATTSALRVSPIVDSTATPSAPPTANDVSAIPAARPASSAAAPDTAAIWALTKAAPRPAPNTTRPTTGGSVVSATLPTASSAVPATATDRTPARVTTACPAKDPTTEATVIAAVVSPNCTGDMPDSCAVERQHQQDPVHAHPGHQQQEVPGDEPSRPHHAPRDQRSDRAPLDQDEDRHQQGGGHQRRPRRLRDRQDEEHERRRSRSPRRPGRRSAGRPTSRRPSGAVARDAASSRMPTGRLTRKIHCHPHSCVIGPPSSSPAVPPTPPIPPQTPSARLRSGPGSNVVSTSDNAVGAMTAAPAPCRTRAADEHRRLVRLAADHRRDGEDRDAHQEHPAAAEQIGDPPPEQQEPAERHEVGAEHPLHVAGRERELVGDRRERHVHDRAVEDDDEERRAEHHQGPGLVHVAQ